MTAEKIIRYYNRLNGKPIEVSKLETLLSSVNTAIAKKTAKGFAADLQSLSERLTAGIADAKGEHTVKVQLIPIDLKRITGQVLRVGAQGDEPKQPQLPAAAAPGAALELPLSKIHTDTKRFQNRQDAFSEASAQSVAENFDPNKFDPIVVWLDPKLNKVFVLSGHSRYEGMKRRKAKTIPVRYFQGTEEQAIKFAKVEANRAANQETLIEDLAAYKLMRDGDQDRGIKKLSKSELSKIFKGKVQKLEAYSYLNPKGLFVEALSQGTTSNFPYLERNAQWIGQLRKENPVISTTGEDNIFHFFYSDKSGKHLKLSKDDFFKLAKKKINQLGKDESILFPECSSDGCRNLVDKETDPVKGESFRRLREINETLSSIDEKLKSKDPKVRVSTEAERNYLIKDLAPKLKAEKEKIQRDLDILDKSQASLFGTDDIYYGLDNVNRSLALVVLKEINRLKEKRNKLKKGSKQRPAIQSKIDRLQREYNTLKAAADETEGLQGLGFTKDGQQKIYDMVTDMVIKAMQKDGLFWREAWVKFKVPMARSFPGNRKYQGVNWFLFNMIAIPQIGYGSPYFLTFKAIKELGGTLKKKSYGFPVVYYSRVYKLDGETISEEKYNALPSDVKMKVNKYPFLRYYKVFNGQDVEGIELPSFDNEIEKRTEPERIEAAERIVEQMPNRPEIDHGGNAAHYIPKFDKVDMPKKKAFTSEQRYYSVLFHELIHSTKHKTRLDRGQAFERKNDLDDQEREYAFEELVAEMGAAYLCAEAGILYHTLNDSASYVKSWSARLEKILKDDNKFIFKAAAAAQKAADYILNRLDPDQLPQQPSEEKTKKPAEKPAAVPVADLKQARLQAYELGKRRFLEGAKRIPAEDTELMQIANRFPLGTKEQTAVFRSWVEGWTEESIKAGSKLRISDPSTDPSPTTRHKKTLVKKGGEQTDMFSQTITKKPTKKSALNPLQTAQLKDSAKQGTVKVNAAAAKRRAKAGDSRKGWTDTPLFKEELESRQTSLFGFMSADRRPKVVKGAFTLPGAIGQILGQLQRYRLSIVISGETHSGKSELGKQIADGFLSIGDKVAWVDWEQGGLESRDTLASIERNISKKNRKKFFVASEVPPTLQAIKALTKQFPVIVLDSGTKLKMKNNDWIDDLRREHPQTVWIHLLQLTSDGKTRGGSQAEFDSPVVIKTFRPDENNYYKNYAKIYKNRGNTTGQIFLIAEQKQVSKAPENVEDYAETTSN